MNQGDFRDTPEFELRAAPPGTYEVRWEVSSAGLRRPASGTWSLRVGEPDGGEPITTLAEAMRERTRFGLD